MGPNSVERVGETLVNALHILNREVDSLDTSESSCPTEQITGFSALLSAAVHAASPRRKQSRKSSCDRLFAVLQTFSPEKPDSDLSSTNVPWLRVGIAHAMAILYNLLANDHALRSKHNSQHVDWLHIALRRSEKLIISMPMLKLWL